MTDEKRHRFWSDPLREITRKERRNLLATSLTAIAIVKVGLVPSKIESLGIEFSSTNQNALLYLLAAIVAYFLCAFLTYAAHDFTSVRALTADDDVNSIMEGKKKIMVDVPEYARDSLDDALKTYNVWGPRAYQAFRIRGIIEFLVPPLVAVYALAILLA